MLRVSEITLPPCREVFQLAEKDMILSKQDNIELFQSRTCMLVPFDVIEVLPFKRYSSDQQPIQQRLAYRLYGLNDSVTLLETLDGRTILLDGFRCFSVWEFGVRNKELPDQVFMNVIRESRELTPLQILQLSTYCNYKSRLTKVKTFLERFRASQAAAFLLLTDSIRENGGRGKKSGTTEVSFELDIATLGMLCPPICKALYHTCLFDDHIVLPIKPQNLPNVKQFVQFNVRACLELSAKPMLNKAVEHLLRDSPATMERYMNRQFLYDFACNWFNSAPLLTQLFLFFVLPSFPYLTRSHIRTSPRANREIRSNIRNCIPTLCLELTTYLSTRFDITRQHLTVHHVSNMMNSDDASSCAVGTNNYSIPLISRLCEAVIFTVTDVERMMPRDMSHFSTGKMTDTLIDKSIHRMLSYSVPQTSDFNSRGTIYKDE